MNLTGLAHGQSAQLTPLLCWFCEFGGWGLRLRWCLSIAALWRSAVPLPFQAVSCPGGGSCSLRSSRRSSVPVLTRASLGGGFLCRKALSVVFSGDGGHGVSSGYVLDALVRLFARWWDRRLLCGSGVMFKPVLEPLKVSGQARAYVFPVCDHSEDDCLGLFVEECLQIFFLVSGEVLVLSLTSFLAFFNSSSFVAHRCFGDFNSRLGSAFKVMAFSTWFWLCLKRFVAMVFFFNGEASRADGHFLSLGLIVLQSLCCWSILIGRLSSYCLDVPLKPPVV
ncbi:hypothetical protein YC2023_024622 [Brassica napus]